MYNLDDANNGIAKQSIITILTLFLDFDKMSSYLACWFNVVSKSSFSESVSTLIFACSRSTDSKSLMILMMNQLNKIRK